MTITAGENCRTQTQSIESRTSHGKFISGELTTLTMTLFKFLADSYADAVTTGRLLCQ